MTLRNYNVSFRNVLLEEVKEEKTKGGIIVPLCSYTRTNEDGSIKSADFKDSSKSYKVVKIGRLCEEILKGDIVTLTPGLRLSEKIIDNKEYIVVFENQIDGYERESIN